MSWSSWDSYKKLVLVPSQTIEFLGFQVNSQDMTIQRISKQTWSFLPNPTPSAREIARIIGILSSCIPAILPAPQHYRALQAMKIKVVAIGGYDHQIPLPQAVRAELHWWCQHLASHDGKPVRSPKTRSNSVYRCLPSWLGSNLSRNPDWRHLDTAAFISTVWSYWELGM